MLKQNQRGAVAPLIAILLIVIVVSVAFVVDLGHIHNVKTELQRAVDAAALAGAQQLPEVDPAILVARATAAANLVDQQQVSSDTEDLTVVVGRWDSLTLTATASQRFTPTNDRPDAVYVRAIRQVDHVFFFFVGTTDVIADAIAYSSPEVPVLPLTIISCIPPTGPEAGSLSVCGIRTYSFASGNNSAGWTSLTWGGAGGSSVQEILSFVSDPEAVRNFNDTAGLLLSQQVDRPCEGNFQKNIICGMNVTDETFTYIAQGVGNPLTRYDRLPRYITTNANEQQAFRDIVSLDGLLTQGTNESASAYQTRLAALSSHVDYGKFVSYDNTKKIYVADFNKVLDAIGYPPVSSTTGSMTSVMDAVLDNVTTAAKTKKIGQFLANYTRENFPFDAEGSATSGGQGQTLLVSIPVIFAGSCANFDPKSLDTNKAQVQEDQELHFIGLASLLITRMFKGNDCYETVSPVTLTGAPACGGGWPDSRLLSNAFACPVTNPPLAFEGLIRPPEYDEEGSLRTIVLVE
jgi:hypothetical protein